LRRKFDRTSAPSGKAGIRHRHSCTRWGVRGYRSRQLSTDQPKNANSIFWTILLARHYLT
jgi:hypothetical protein